MKLCSLIDYLYILQHKQKSEAVWLPLCTPSLSMSIVHNCTCYADWIIVTSDCRGRLTQEHCILVLAALSAAAHCACKCHIH